MFSAQCFCHLASMSANGYPPDRAAVDSASEEVSATSDATASRADDDDDAPREDDDATTRAAARFGATAGRAHRDHVASAREPRRAREDMDATRVVVVVARAEAEDRGARAATAATAVDGRAGRRSAMRERASGSRRRAFETRRERARRASVTRCGRRARLGGGSRGVTSPRALRHR